MSSIILYATSQPIPGIAYDKVVTNLGILYIRNEVVEGCPLDALDDVDPKPGETVLNTVPYPLGWDAEDLKLLAALGVKVPSESGPA